MSVKAQVPLFTLNDSQEEYLIDKANSFIDTTAQLRFEQIQKLNSAGKFIPANPGEPFEVNPQNIYWLAFDLKNNINRDQNWILNFQNWSVADLYIMEGDSLIETKKTGHLVELKERDYPHANRNYFLVHFKQGESKSFFVKLNPQKNNRLFPTNLSFKVAERNVVDRQNRSFQAISYGILAAYLVFFVYNLFIFLSTRNKTYLYYLIMVAAGFVLALNYSGYFLNLFSFISPTVPLSFYMERFLINGFSIALLLFSVHFFRVKERYPKFWYKLFMGLLVALVISTLVILFDFDLGLIPSFPTYIVLNTALIVFAIKNVRAKYPSSIYYLVGFSIVWIGGLLMVLSSVLKLLEPNDFTAFLAVPAGQIIEMLIFSFALANMINVLKVENEEKQKEIILHLQEKEELQAKVNRELEEKVAERTEEILEQKKVIEDEKERAEKLLLNILPKVTAEELKTFGSATPKFYEQVTILFTDFYGFTNLAEQLSTDDLVKELDYCFGAFDEIITRNRLEKIKTIGDAYMCAGGIPVPNTTNPQDAIRAALEIRHFMNHWNQEKVNRGEQKWELRIGIHTGSVTAGVVGKIKFVYDIWGDAVNLASRMESSCELGEINISSSTFNLVQEDFNCKYRGKIEAKNKGLVEMYYVMNGEGNRLN